MKKSFKFLLAAGLSALLFASCGPGADEATSTSGDNSSYGQDHPAVGTDGGESGSRMADTNRIDDGSIDGTKGKSTNPNLP